MAGPPPACDLQGGTLAGAVNFTLTWYRVWPITYDINDRVGQFNFDVQQVHNAGGTIIEVTFKDAAGNALPGQDRCGNSLPPQPPTVPPITLTPPTCPPGYTYNPTTEMCDLGPIPFPGPGVGGGGGSGGGGSGGGTPPPPPTPSCPPGFHWDANRELCVADPLPIIPPQPGGDDGDEFTDCCQETLIALEAIREAVVALKPISGGAPTGQEECCIKVVEGLAGIVLQLEAISQAMAKAGTKVNVALDFTPLVDAIATLKTSLDALPAQMGGDTDKLVTALDGIKEAMGGVASPHHTFPDPLDMLRALLHQLDETGVLDSTIVQTVTPPKFG